MGLEFSICIHSKRITQNKMDIILCQKKAGKGCSRIPFLGEKEICVATIIDLKTKRIVPNCRVDENRMYKCSSREEYIPQSISIYQVKKN